MKFKIALLLAMVFSAYSSHAINKVVYGEDDRLDIYQVSNPLYLDLAKSTAAMISKSQITSSSDEFSQVNGRTLAARGICESARFSQQITSANCSGFLVGPDLLVTAGHCVTRQSDCDTYKWVFDYALESEGDKDSFEVETRNVYGCKKIIAQSLNRSTKDDYAVIQLDRVVEGREPLRVRTEGRVETGAPLVVIGHPTGLPTKVAAGANVRGNSNNVFFVANLDTFGGNSGSAVFNAETGVVEGILVRGETDYEYDSSRGCTVPKQCTNDGCRGEDVTRITNISEVLENL